MEKYCVSFQMLEEALSVFGLPREAQAFPLFREMFRLHFAFGVHVALAYVNPVE